MKFEKGRSGNPKGKPKGVPNKTTAALKEAILTAARLAGEDIDPKAPDGTIAYLRALAKTDGKAFSGLLGKVLPMTIGTEGDGKGRLLIAWESDPDRR